MVKSYSVDMLNGTDAGRQSRKTAGAAAQPEITQVELGAILLQQSLIEHRMTELRRRLDAGATIQPGKYTVEALGDADGFQFPRRLAGLVSSGVSIDATA